MSRRIWLMTALTVLLATWVASGGVAAKGATIPKENRAGHITRGLDYLCARQADDGGFNGPQNTSLAVLGAIASGERIGSKPWHNGGKNPFTSLQSADLVAESATPGNAAL